MSAFNEEALTEKLSKLNNSQQSIVTLSHWCVYHRKRAKLVVQIWNTEFAKAPKERRLAFIYLANDVLQNSRKKGPEFVDEFYKVMPRAFKHLSKRADEKDKASLMKLIKVWEERKVFGHSLPPAIRESLLGTASEEKEERGAKRGAVEMLSGTMGGVAAAYKALESAEAQEARASSVCACALPADLLAENAPTRAAEAGRTPQLMEQLHKALESIDAYRGCLEESLTQRENFIGAIRDAQRSQEEAFEEAETKLAQMREQSEKVTKLLEQAQALEGQEPRAAVGEPVGEAASSMGEAASSESSLAAGADAAGQVADCLAALENPAAALRDALSGLSARSLTSSALPSRSLPAPMLQKTEWKRTARSERGGRGSWKDTQAHQASPESQ